MSIIFAGNTYGNFENFTADALHKRHIECKDNDFVLFCGNFGYPWLSGSTTDEAAESVFNNSKLIYCFVGGCHENYYKLLHGENKRFCGDTAVKLYDNVYWLKRGHIYEIDGHKIFAFGGGESPDRIYRQEGVTYWPEESITDDDFRLGVNTLLENNRKVDFVATYSSPRRNGTESEQLMALIMRAAEYKLWFSSSLNTDRYFSKERIRSLDKDVAIA